MLLLFDIDGTLIRCGGAGRRALERAFFERLQIRNALKGVRLDGRSDPAIIEDVLVTALGVDALDPGAFEALIETYVFHLERELASDSNVYEILPGVRDLLIELVANESCTLGLATGNHERGAKLKLAAGSLDAFFSFGAYGSDVKERSRIVQIAVERGRAQQRKSGDSSSRADDVFVFGDTALDVEAGRAAGARTVGILHGSLHRDELITSQPDFLFESFSDSGVRELVKRCTT